MRRTFSLLCMIAVSAARPAWAQPPEEDLEEPRLRPPTLEPIEIEEREEEIEEAVEEEVETPAEAAGTLEADLPPEAAEPEPAWTAPQTVLSLDGYFRVRSELWDTFWLGRPGTEAPFSRFLPIDRRGAGAPAGGCGGEGGDDASCDTEALAFANMRLRLTPTLSLSDDVRVHAMFDVLDNVVLGSTPEDVVTVPTGGDAVFERTPRVGRVPLDSAVPPMRFRNSISDSIRVRRAWAEVTSRGLGQLRFGRMGWHWGLGILANGGEGIDADFQTDVDRIMAVTELAGFYLSAAWDFTSEGFIDYQIEDPVALAVDRAQEDDIDQYVFSVSRRLDEEEQAAELQRGGFVLNGGLTFIYRDQLLSAALIHDWYGSAPSITSFIRRDAELFIPDVWVQLLYGDLRVELEAVLTAGSIGNVADEIPYMGEEADVLQLGAALESEYRLLDDKLGLYLYAGFATGDSDVEGLAVTEDTRLADAGDRISTFRFHPNYRVDLILWRNIIQQVSGAYYVRPGISYDFIRNSFGQLFGLRADVIWSRATSSPQTWGNDADLGVEIDARLYYRSEDGPELFDGFYGSLEYGILFPLAGLRSPGDPDLENAQILRLILGVQY